MDYNKNVIVSINLSELDYIINLLKYSLLRDKEKLFKYDSFMLNSILQKLVVTQEESFGKSE